MRRAVLVAAALLVGLTAAADADAQRRRHRPGGSDHNWHDRWENRRDARRAGAIVGVTTRIVAGAAARGRAEQRYENCIYATGYDYACERRYYYDRSRGRRFARRSGAAAGAAAWAIVRD